MELNNIKDEIIDMYLNRGMTTVDISLYFGCHSSSVGKLLHRNGIELRPGGNRIKLSTEQRNKIYLDYVSGSTSVELAQKYGVCDGTIRKIVREGDGVIRPAKRRSKIKKS